jgi:hypothetical protein
MSRPFFPRIRPGAVCAETSGRILVAAALCLLATGSLRLLAERMELIRKGVMVDPSVCECQGIGSGWKDIRTRYFKVQMDRDVDAEAVERQLRRRFFFPGRQTPRDLGPEEGVARRIDAICDRAMDILNVFPKMDSPGIKIFKGKADLGAAYRTLTGRSEDVKAFHVQDCRMIYTSEETINDSVIAHEIAHAIVDAHYNGIPPPKVGEMLASYVDMHLAE